MSDRDALLQHFRVGFPAAASTKGGSYDSLDDATERGALAAPPSATRAAAPAAAQSKKQKKSAKKLRRKSESVSACVRLTSGA
jgi:hypothetical protein